jgi:hypothetical protein
MQNRACLWVPDSELTFGTPGIIKTIRIVNLNSLCCQNQIIRNKINWGFWGLRTLLTGFDRAGFNGWTTFVSNAGSRTFPEGSVCRGEPNGDLPVA